MAVFFVVSEVRIHFILFSAPSAHFATTTFHYNPEKYVRVCLRVCPTSKFFFLQACKSAYSILSLLLVLSLENRILKSRS